MERMSSEEFAYRVNKEIDLFNRANRTDFGTGMSGQIHIERIDDEFDQEPASFGVNWSACGCQSAEDTQKFANQLMAAGALADHLTMKQWICDYTLDGSAFVDKVKELRKETGIQYPV